MRHFLATTNLEEFPNSRLFIDKKSFRKRSLQSKNIVSHKKCKLVDFFYTDMQIVSEYPDHYSG